MIKLKMLLFLTMLVSSTMVYAQQEEKAVLTTVENLRLALISGDRTALDTITADNLSYWHSDGRHEDKATFIGNLTSGKSDFVHINLSKQSIKLSDNVALVHHILTADTNDGGVPGKVKLGVLLVFQKYPNGWKLFARQAYKTPH
ncbi:nuclear transport factor 2 family protein [Olivibacter ginsenosidimutans]|uniref:Nuclear transport factor 2 family protein n=1 Tax=Olivibacter ginsenosidimutans TaxID=1176537 RepID=A0ABP9BC37_9SPHI